MKGKYNSIQREKKNKPVHAPDHTPYAVCVQCAECSRFFNIEGLHDAVHTYTRTILPRHLVSFLYGVV